jgi:hypothetical protein
MLTNVLTIATGTWLESVKSQAESQNETDVKKKSKAGSFGETHTRAWQSTPAAGRHLEKTRPRRQAKICEGE